MKYITAELLCQQDSDCPETVQKVNEIIHQKFFEYEKYFDSIKNMFPKTFMKIYEKNSRFHDWSIESILYEPSISRKNDIVKLKLSYFGESYIIVFKHVSNFVIDMDFSRIEWNIAEKDICYSDEWEILSNGKICYEMLTLSHSSIKILCEKVSINKVDKHF